MFLQSPPLGNLGLLPDQPNSALPLGAWKDGKNVRFNDAYIEKIREPRKLSDLVVSEAGKWLQIYEDGSGPQAVYASDTKLFKLDPGGTSWTDVTRLSGAYTGGGDWHSFQWGDSVVFNNGLDIPQILYDGAANFVDLPNWGLLTSGQKVVTAKSLRGFKNFMIASNIIIDGDSQPNAVWWSSPGVIDNDVSNFDAPSWDYEDTTELSGLNYVAVEDGPIIDSLDMGNSQMIYTRVSGYELALVGGNFVFKTVPIVPYGIASLGAVAKFSRFHFCVGPNTIYLHDRTLPRPIGDARVERDFFSRLSDFEVRCTENVAQKEIHAIFNRDSGKEYLIYNYNDDNFSFGDATVGTESVVCMAFDIQQGEGATTWADLTVPWSSLTQKWSDFAGTGERRTMFWLTDAGFYEAEASNGLDDEKEYYLINPNMDFSEVNPQITTNSIKELYQVYPHIEGKANTRFTVAAFDRLNQTTETGQIVEDFSPADDEKVDIDVAGRYISLRMDIIGNGEWRLSAADYELELPYAR